MTEDKAVVKRSPGDLVRESHPEASIYEVIVKFHKDGRPVIETFLLAHMVSVSISQTENPQVLFAYCHFKGDIKILESKLAALRQSAMVILGDKEEKFLDFFVALRQLSQPLPRLLLPLGRSGVLPAFIKPEWLRGFLLALGFLGLFVIWQGYNFLSGSISPRVNSPPLSSPPPTPIIVSQWSLYVLPEYHQVWLEVKKKHGLSDEMMINLFRTIKQIDKYGPGHQLRDLTIYPEAIDRSLGLIILKDVGDVETLRALYQTLGGYYLYSKSLPDDPESRMGISLFANFNDYLVLTFFEQLLKEPRKAFTERLIQELRRSHLSG